MNYFSHAIRFLHRPWFIAGTAAPDWLSACDRSVRLREKAVAAFLDDPEESVREFAAGVMQHFHDDDWFHRTRGFAEVTTQLTVWVRDAIGSDDGFRCGLLGHVGTELLIDAILTERHPQKLAEYYQRIVTVPPAWIAEQVNRMSRKPTENLAWFVPMFLRERVLEDYADDRRMLVRLNQVWRRIKLGTLPDPVLSALSKGRDLVRERLPDLLPQEHFPMP